MHALTPILLDTAIKATLLLLLAAAFVPVLRRWSATRRHLFWFTCIAVVLCLPIAAQQTAAPVAVKYTYRRPDYALRAEPQRVPPRTLDDRRERVSPDRAVVFGWPIRWWSSHWSSSLNTQNAAMISTDAMQPPRFVVTEPGRRKVWVKYFDVPIDPQRYPLVVLTYRATNTHAAANGYVLYLDDTSGPDYGGLLPFSSRDLQADGEVHSMTCDLRTLDPLGELIGLAIGVHAADQAPAPATFELLDLRFEAIEPNAMPVQDAPLTVRVTDPQGNPIRDAVVTADAERANWTQQAMTDVYGEATVRPYSTAAGRHMIRVSKPGLLPVEMRDLPDDRTQPLVMTTVPAAVCAGVVVDENNQPVANAAVRVHSNESNNLWTRNDAWAITDAQGRWRTAPLAGEPFGLGVQASHPDFAASQSFHTFSTPEERAPLHDGSAVITLTQRLVQVEVQLVDEAGLPITGRARLSPTDTRHVWQADDRLRLWLSQDMVLPTPEHPVIAHPDYLAAMIPLPRMSLAQFEQKAASEPAPRVIRMTLHAGEPTRVRLVNEAGEPPEGLRVSIDQAGGRFRASLTRDDAGLWLSWRTAAEASAHVGVSDRRDLRDFQFELTPDMDGRTIIVPQTPSEPTGETPASDPRREGYDPEKIFRRLS